MVLFRKTELNLEVNHFGLRPYPCITRIYHSFCIVDANTRLHDRLDAIFPIIHSKYLITCRLLGAFGLQSLD